MFRITPEKSACRQLRFGILNAESPWCEAARDSTKLLGIETYLVDNIADPDGRFAEVYGISPSGAIIVCPDGFVGWRTKTADGASFLRVSDTLASLLRLEVRGEPA